MGDEAINGRHGSVNEVVTADIGTATDVTQDRRLDSPIKQPAQGLTNGSLGHDGPAASTENQSQADRSDSEAETVVSPGKRQTQEQKEIKSIKLEDGGSETDRRHKETTPHAIHRRTSDEHRPNGLKRKRGEEQPQRDEVKDEQNSSELSSNRSSPAPRAHSSKTSDSESENSPSSSPFDDEHAPGQTRPQGSASRRDQTKRRATDSAEPKHPNPRRHGRRTPGETSQRSESPQTSVRSRTRPSGPNGGVHGGSKRRRPAPLNVERRKRTSEDAEAQQDSDDDSSVQSRHPVHRVQPHEGHAMSPIKVSHKKNIDRSGRTLLARACAIGFEEAQRWLKERPQDINIPDYAGNTPLQIASLQGQDEVVQLLLDAKCDTTCKNLDGDTPLIDAVENCCAGVVKLLLKAGVDPRQRNKKGQEPVELVDEDDEDCDEIRGALVQAKVSCDVARRQSDDQKRNTRDGNTPSAHASATSPSESTRSPPPNPEVASRKRSARSQQSEGALLWVSPTPQRLKEEAGKGNLMVVNHILGMRPQVETEAVIAAVKGGHYDVVSCMLGFGKVEADPVPLRVGDLQPGHNTPMLTAIGRGTPEIIELLLSQTAFDPTQRLYKGLSYPELAGERRGERWQEERSILQKAIDTHEARNGSSPRRHRKTKTDKLKDEDDDMPQESRKARKLANQNKESELDLKRQSTYQGTANKLRRSLDRESVISTGDRASSKSTSGSKPKLLDRPRSAGNEASHGPQRPDFKPRRKLMSGNDLKIGQDAKRRAKSGDAEDADSKHEHKKSQRRLSVSSQSSLRSHTDELRRSVKKASSEEPPRSGDEHKRKRLRNSASPEMKKMELKKKPRIDLKGDEQPAIKPNGSLNSFQASSSSPAGTSSPGGQGAAPVAFMGAPTASPTTMSPSDHPTSQPNINLIDEIMPDASSTINHVTDSASPRQASEVILEHDSNENASSRDGEVEKVKEAVHRDEAEKAKEITRKQDLQRERKEQERRERKRLEEEAANLDAKRRIDEAERQAQLQREAEEARLAKVKRDEEMQRRRLEEEKQRQEEQERRRREREEREAIRRLKRQEEERRALLDTLPNGLRKGVELGLEASRELKQIQRWLPLRTATTEALQAGSTGEGPAEKWIANIQAAPLLANQDLDLSQFVTLTRFNATPAHIEFLWRQLRVPMSVPDPEETMTPTQVVELEAATRPKFSRLSVFWIKLADFLDLVPRHQHLNGVDFTKTRKMAMKYPPLATGGFGLSPPPRYTQSPIEMGKRTPMVNGNSPVGEAWGS